MKKLKNIEKSRLCPAFDFDLRHIETFCKVVELASFSRAAEELYITQASASERVAKLEKSLGTTLLDRLGRKVVPSQVGKVLYERASKLLELKKQTCLEIEDFLGVKRGEIVLGGSTIPGEYILPDFVGRFRKKYPLISVRLSIADTGVITSGVREGKFEFGVVGSQMDDECLEYKKLWQDEIILVVPKGHHLASKKNVNLKSLQDEPFLMRERGSGTRRILEEKLLKQHGINFGRFNIIAELGSSTAIKEGIKKGLGISFLSSWSVQSEIKRDELKVVALKDFEVQRFFFLVRDKRRATSPICSTFQDFLLKQV